MLGSILPGYQHLQNIHPMVVHFPIAFLVGAAIFYFIASLLHSKELALVGFFMLLIGTLGAMAAAGTGLYAEDGVMIDQTVKDNLLYWHKYLMLTVGGISIVLSVWAALARTFPEKWRLVFLTLFLAMLFFMIWGADFGGRMVYDYNAGGTACKQFIEFSK